MRVRNDSSKTTLFIADVGGDETTENDLRQLQATGSELLASLVERVHALEEVLESPAAPHGATNGAEPVNIAGIVGSVSVLDATIHEIRGNLERVKSYLATSPEAIAQASNGSNLLQGQRRE